MLYANRYAIQEKLGSGGMGTVYIAEDRFNRNLVALKQITTESHNLQFNSQGGTRHDNQLALAQEFRLLASLQHPHIIRVYDYGFDADGYPFYTMKLLRDAQSLLDAAPQFSREGKLRLLAQATQALLYLHRRGVLHRDLSPNNVLVTSDNQVMLLDFGLAVGFEMQQQFAGTLPYIAPEVLQGDNASPASDLYALGVLFYQLFAGVHPFQAESSDELMLNVLTVAPNLNMLPETERGIIGRLLEKDPRKRYASADELLKDLSNYAQETITIRESFLQAADFVGRDTEMSVLLTALENATKGIGSAWLIAGESGIGKSRLLDEIRTHGLVSGALVLRGQAASEGGLPYQLWRDVTRRLSLLVEVNDTEAGVLQSLVSDIAEILGRPVVEAPELEGVAQQQRLALTLASLFERVMQPMLLLLEDIHWSTESLELLKQLAGRVSQLPLLILATFRNDERPNLPELLPMMDGIYSRCHKKVGSAKSEHGL